jgi:F-type H+-transporting ATPase subunit alpha
MSTTIVERIKREIERFAPDTAHAEEIGAVVSVGDGVVEIEGLSKAQMSEVLVFDEGKGASLEALLAQPTPLFALVLNLEEQSIKAVLLGDTSRVREGMTVRRVGKILSIPVGEALLGRVVNALGEEIDGKGEIKTTTPQENAHTAPAQIDRRPEETR